MSQPGEREGRIAAETKLLKAHPILEDHERRSQCAGLFGLREAARCIIGADDSDLDFYAMAELCFTFRSGKNKTHLPLKNHIRAKRARVTDPDNGVMVFVQTMLTQKGIDWLKVRWRAFKADRTGFEAYWTGAPRQAQERGRMCG